MRGAAVGVADGGQAHCAPGGAADMASKVESMEPIEPGTSLTGSAAEARTLAVGGHAPTPAGEAVLPAAELVPAVPTQPAALLPGDVEMPAPSPFLRAWRFLGGLGALAVAWAAAILAYLLLTNARTILGHFELVPVKIVVLLVGALAVLWLAVAFLACAVAGAYCLVLATTRRRW